MRFEKSRRKHKKVFFGLYILVLVLVFLVFHKLFSINEVNLKFSNKPCEKVETIERSIKVKGKNIFFLNIKKIDEEIKNRFICIQSAQIKRQLPATINVNLKSREPVLRVNYYSISTPSGILSLKDISISSKSARLNIPQARLKFEGNFFLDKDGVIISNDSSKFFFSADLIGDKPKLFLDLGDFIRKSIEILIQVKKLPFFTTRVLIVQDKFLIFYGKPDVIFSLKKDPKQQVASLQLILEQAKMNSNQSEKKDKDSKGIIKIDLRYDKPVIVFSNK